MSIFQFHFIYNRFSRIYQFQSFFSPSNNSIGSNRAYLVHLFFSLQVSTSGNFELQILEISNTNSHLLSGYCCGVPLSIRSTKTTGCPQCATAFRLCLKEYQQSTVQTQPGVLNGCSFGNVTSGVIGGSSFVLSDLVAKAGSLVLPFTFRWTVSIYTFIHLSLSVFHIISLFSIIHWPAKRRRIRDTRDTFSIWFIFNRQWTHCDRYDRYRI